MSARSKGESAFGRRDFLKHSVVAAGAIGASTGGEVIAGERGIMAARAASAAGVSAVVSGRKPDKYSGTYAGETNNRVAFPMGGIGAGMICLEGTGKLSHVSLRNRPEIFHEPLVFAALCVKGKDGNVARVLEGPVQSWKIFGQGGTGNGGAGRDYGLPRMAESAFSFRFPFGTCTLTDPKIPAEIDVTGWSPFVPGDADSASLPVAALEYRFKNPTGSAIDAVFSFNAKNFMRTNSDGEGVRSAPNGFILAQDPPKDKPWETGYFCARVIDEAAKVNCAWFRGGWWDSLTMAWKDVQEGACYDRAPITEGQASPGGTIFVPITLAPGEEKVVTVQMCWYAEDTHVRHGADPEGTPQPTECCEQNYQPWYSERFADINAVRDYWQANYDDLRRRTMTFTDCFYDTTLPPEVIEAVAANLTILKSPTVLRERNGKLWCYEGCTDGGGCCHGSCTHVWNYAQAIPHLFPTLERSLRETEFEVSQDDRGHQAFRSSLPIRPTKHDFHAASDGQLGGIMKVFRDWRIGGDTAWLKTLWPKVKQSIDYCIATWDPRHKGVLEEPHHNTYDIEFWGPDGMCSSFYLGALAAASQMGKALNEDVALYDELYAKGCKFLETELFDGEYFVQKIQWKGLNAPSPTEVQSAHRNYSPESLELLEKEGPKYQYGSGCISDGVLGSWLAMVCGVGQVLDADKVTSHVQSVHRYNLRRDLTTHANPQRPTFACGAEGGLLLCSWPKGGALSLPFVYSDEVWTGIEYQVASHLMLMGRVEEGLDIVRVCRDRYDGRIRNPFNEYECGHWYARAMSSYGLLQGLTGVRYDAVEKTLHVEPRIKGDFRSFLSTDKGFATVGVKNGKPFIDTKSGKIEIAQIKYTPAM